jgi:hypothetical protein
MANSFKFLTKWRNTFGPFSWEEMNVFMHCRTHIFKFLHQLKMNYLASHSELPSGIVTRFLANCTNTYIIDQKIFASVKVCSFALN